MIRPWIILALAVLTVSTGAVGQERGRIGGPGVERFQHSAPPRFPGGTEFPDQPSVVVPPPPPPELRDVCTRHFECDRDCQRASGYNFCPDNCKHVVCD